RDVDAFPAEVLHAEPARLVSHQLVEQRAQRVGHQRGVVTFQQVGQTARLRHGSPTLGRRLARLGPMGRPTLRVWATGLLGPNTGIGVMQRALYPVLAEQEI